MKDRFVIWIAVGLIALIAIMLGAFVYLDAKSEKITLNKSEWVCTKTKTQVSNVIAGKVIAPQITKDCVRYERKH